MRVHVETKYKQWEQNTPPLLFSSKKPIGRANESYYYYYYFCTNGGTYFSSKHKHTHSEREKAKYIIIPFVQ